MIQGRWLDHLPPWMAWGAVATTGLYSPLELAAMAVPLLAAAAAEWRGASLYRFRRALEIAALAVFLLHVALRAGVLATTVDTLFVLCGVRLCLPRETPQRRQILLMGFLVFLTTAISTAEIDFLAWCVVWTAGGGYCLLHLNWERAAQLQAGSAPRAPLRAAPLWLAATVALGAGFFVTLPRLRTGVRNLPLGVQSLAGLRTGLSGVLDLSFAGPVRSSSEVALRVVPARPSPEFAQAYGLLRGIVLERLEGQRWEASRATPRRLTARWGAFRFAGGDPFPAEVYLSPDPLALVPVPYGRVDLEPPEGEPLRTDAGAALRIGFPMRRILDLKMGVDPDAPELEPPPFGERRAFLLEPGEGTECALRWSLRVAPADLPARELAERLTRSLRAYAYTLDNPSGGRPNPLEDFLERSRAGHCEYFASALAVMLRRRGVPARVVNGFRLGSWIAEGGYYLVTQGEAHSWVEFYDPDLRGWRVADPTPPAPPSAFGTNTLLAALSRWKDDLEFRWDRNVVRFSDEDQMAAIGWFQARAASLAAGPGLPPPRVLLAVLGALGILALAWRAGLRGRVPAGVPGAILELRPLVRTAGRERPPLAGETARAWLKRLASLRPERSAPLDALAREADAAAYGGKGASALARMAKEEAASWKGRRS